MLNSEGMFYQPDALQLYAACKTELGARDLIIVELYIWVGADYDGTDTWRAVCFNIRYRIFHSITLNFIRWRMRIIRWGTSIYSTGNEGVGVHGVARLSVQ